MDADVLIDYDLFVKRIVDGVGQVLNGGRVFPVVHQIDFHFISKPLVGVVDQFDRIDRVDLRVVVLRLLVIHF